MNRDIIAFTKYKFNVYGKKDIRSGRDSAVVGIVGKSKSLDFPTMLIFWSLVRNSVVLAVYLLFSVACFLTVHEHYVQNISNTPSAEPQEGCCPYLIYELIFSKDRSTSIAQPRLLQYFYNHLRPKIGRASCRERVSSPL